MSDQHDPMERYIDLLHALAPATQPRWGSMSAQQMVEHLAAVVRVSNGKVKVPVETGPGKLPLAQAFLASDKPLPRNARPAAFSAMPPLKHHSIADAIREVHDELNAFHVHYLQPGQKETHPVFGELDYEGWKRFHRKHFIHHLTQFGLIEEK